jgi:WD40 repeat protein
MSYCLNPHCRFPQNPQGAKYCQTCGQSLILKQHYQAIRKIGQGGFGRTFLALDRSQEKTRRCAIKQLTFESKNPDQIRKATDLFEQEAQRLIQLGNHPQIPKFYHYFHEGENHYLVQEYRPGENLEVISEQTGKWTEPQIRDLLKKLLPVLNYIHDRQVIHRDIKPANIIQGLNGAYSLVDFGSAKYVTETALINTGTTIGSPEYVAPEQMRGKAIYASDLYSLGVTCLYLLTQVSPFLLFDSSEGHWVWREYLGNTQISDKLGDILDRLIQLGTKHRYRCARDAYHALKPEKKLPPPPPRPQFFAHSESQTWRCVQTLEGHRGSVCALAISPDGQLLASGSFDRSIKIWNLETGSLEETLNLHTNPVLTLAFSPVEHQLASGSIDDVIKIWDFVTGTVYCTGLEHYGSTVSLSVAYHPQGKAIASGGDDRRLQIWSMEGDCHYSIPHPRGINTVAFSPGGEYIASGSSDNQIYLWHVETGEPITQLTGHKGDINALSFSQDGQYLATGSSDLTVKLWNLSQLSSNPLPQHTFSPCSDWVRAVTFSSDNQQLIAATADGSLIIWDLSTLKIRQTLREHIKDINAIVMNPIRSLMATASRDTTIKIWIGD